MRGLDKNHPDPLLPTHSYAPHKSTGVSIADQLRGIRTLRGMTQEDVAHLVGTAQPGIARAEDPDYDQLSLAFLRRIADALDCRVIVTIEPVERCIIEREEKNHA